MAGQGRVSVDTNVSTGVAQVSGSGHLPRTSAVRSVAPEPGSGWLVGVPVRIPGATEVPIVIILLGRDGRSRLGTGGRMHADPVQTVLFSSRVNGPSSVTEEGRRQGRCLVL